jgi:hypothetical protein
LNFMPPNRKQQPAGMDSKCHTCWLSRGTGTVHVYYVQGSGQTALD